MKLTIKEAQKIENPNLRFLIMAALRKKIKVDKFLCNDIEHYRFEYKGKIRYTRKGVLPNVNIVSGKMVVDKNCTKDLLTAAKIKTPKGFLINSLKDLRTLIKTRKIKFPLVIKPNTETHGAGVWTYLYNFQDCQMAIQDIRKKSKAKDFIAEEFFEARDYRLLVLNHRIIAALERIHPYVIGDGTKSIQQLIKKYIKETNQELSLDNETKTSIKQQGFALADVLPKKHKLTLTFKANISVGGIGRNVTGKVAPYFQALATKVTKALDINYCGVDILTKDISKKGDYRIIEVNSPPDYFIHMFPQIGKSIDVPNKILAALFKN
ncbi:hypothetical protein ACFL2B_01630 [Patescibacteria group bacterium]